MVKLPRQLCHQETYAKELNPFQVTETGVMVSANVASSGLKSPLVFIEDVEMNGREFTRKY